MNTLLCVVTGKEILERQSARTFHHLTLVLGDLDEQEADTRLHRGARSIREQVVHLCESYHALTTTFGGGKHDWGSYVAPISEWPAVRDLAFLMREEAYGAILNDDQERLQGFLSNILSHENYHIGQMVAIRLVMVRAVPKQYCPFF